MLLDEQRVVAGLEQMRGVGVPKRSRLSSGGSPARWRNAVNDRPSALSVNLPPRSLGHNAGERSAVLNSLRPSVHQYCKSSTAQENSGEVSTVRRRGPDPLVPLAHRTVTAP